MVMDRNFKLLGELAQFTSLQYARGYYSVGDFHLEMSRGAPCADMLRQGVLLFPPDAPHKMMEINDMTVDEMTIKADGSEIKGDVRKRVCVPPLALPKTLYQWTGTQWKEITDGSAIFALLKGDVYEGYVFPSAPFVGMVYVDMTQLASVYDWEKKTSAGETWLDLGVARKRSQYKNFGWDRVICAAESAIKHFVKNNLVAPEDEKRRIPGLIIAPDLGRGEVLPWQARFDKLETVLQVIGEKTGMGYRVTPDFDSKTFVFDIMQGKDYSSGKKRVVISRDMGNAGSVTLKMQWSNTYTTAYTGGAGQDEERLILTVGEENTGAFRREMWVDAGSVDDAEMIKLSGQNKLGDAAAKTSLTAKVIDSGACRYERDWDVGDVVLIRANGALSETRVLQVTETYERDRERQLDVVFGTSPVSIVSAIQRLQSQTVR